MSTSKPRSAKALAITFWPRSWPSWPILATRMRGRAAFGRLERPSPCAHALRPSRLPRPSRLFPDKRPEIELDLRRVATEHLLQREADLAHRGLGPRRVHTPDRKQVAVAFRAAVSASSDVSPHRFVAIRLGALQLVDLHPRARRRCRPSARRSLVLVRRPELVDADDASGRPESMRACVRRRPPRCAVSGCRPRWPSPCRRASRPPRYALHARAARS